MSNQTTIQTTLNFQGTVSVPIQNWGDSLIEKTQDTFRIYFQNINGIGPKHIDRWNHMVHTTINTYNSDIVGFCETGIQWTSHHTRNKIKLEARKVNKTNINITHSKNTVKPTSSFLPGGTLLMTKNSWTGRIISPLEDPLAMGRWSGQKYRLQGNRHFYIISAYRACPKPSHNILPQSNSTFAQQFFKIREMGNPDPNPRQQFITDLTQYITDLNIKDHDMILVMLDGNEPLCRQNKGISQLIHNTRLEDIFSLHHAESCNLPTQVKGSQRIDYMLGTTNLLPYISKCGYLPFHQDIVTDHRGMFLDIQIDMLDLTTICKAQPTRDISSQNKMKQTTKYKQYIIEQFDQHNISARASISYLQAPHITPETNGPYMKRLNKLDQQITTILLKAEKRIAPITTSLLRNSDIDSYRLLIRYWQIKISSIKNNKDFSKPMTVIRNQLESPISDLLTKYEHAPVEGLKETKKRLTKEIKRYTQELQITNDLEFALIAEAETISPNQVKTRHTQEKLNKYNFANIRSKFNPIDHQGITKILVPNNNDPTGLSSLTIHNPVEVESQLIQRNIKHFGQAQGSPFTNENLTQHLGYDGVTQTANTIITGGNIDTITNNIDGPEAQILNALNDGNNDPIINTDITLNEYMSGFRNWKERTSTSPSGRHLGHYKALLRAEAPDKPNTEDTDSQDNLLDQPPPTKTKRNQQHHPQGRNIFEVLFQVSMSALRAGETLTRWTNAYSSMIEKDKGKPHINRLRVIHLYEADYNLLLKLLWARRLTWNAHKQGSLHPSQAGSRPGRKAIDLVIFKEQKYLYSTLTRTNLLTMDNDAKACYDRIICNLAMLISQYYGMPQHACKTQAKTIEQMKFYIRTAIGISDESYQHTTETPIHGSGQGSCASPTLWLLISSLLMRILESRAKGMTMQDIIKDNKEIISAIDGFVDDTSLFTNLLLHLTDPQQEIDNLQQATQIWSELLEASGGKLELSKCFYYALIWTFNKDGDPIPTTIDEQQAMGIKQIKIVDRATGQVHPIAQKECEEPHKTLGVHKNIIGKDAKQYNELLTKSNNMAYLASTAEMSRVHARIAYNSTYITTMSYGLPACSLSLEQLTNIQSRALFSFLPAMGYMRTTSRALIHGPIEYGGYNIPHLYAIHGAQKIATVMTHIRAGTDLGATFIINSNWLQLISGRSLQFFSDPHPLMYIKANWLLHLKHYMNTTHLTFHANKFWVPRSSRRNDKNLMDHACIHSENKNVLQIINRWRLYYQVLRLSDICDASGSYVLDEYRVYNPPTQTPKRTSTINWPRQPQPPKSSFKVWRRYLQQTFGMQIGGALRDKLDVWQETLTTSENKWESYYSPSSKKMYIPILPTWHIHTYKTISRRTCSFEGITEGTTEIPPEDIIPVTITSRKHNTIHVSSQLPLPIPTPIPPRVEPTFTTYIQKQQLWQQSLCQHWGGISEERVRAHLELQESIHLAITGQYYQSTGYYAYTMAVKCQVLLWNKGKCVDIDGAHKETRMTWMGILSAVASLRMILEYIQYNNNNIIKHCNLYTNKNFITNRITKLLREGVPLNEHMSPDIDIILQIIAEVKSIADKFSIKMNFHTIQKTKKKKKQQNDDTPQIPDHPHLALLELSKTHTIHARTEKVKQMPVTLYYPASTIQVLKNNLPVTAKVFRTTMNAHTEIEFFQYQRTRFNWTQTIHENIWWDIHHKALLTYKPAARQILQKFHFNQWACNKHAHMIHEYRSPICEACGRIEETCDHIIQCDNPAQIKIRTDFKESIETFFTNSKVSHEVALCLKEGILAWIENKKPKNINQLVPNASQTLKKAYINQLEIGWGHFIRGRVSIEWITIINYDLQNKTNTPPRKGIRRFHSADPWGLALINIMWNMILTTWETRNKTVQQIYINTGQTRDNSILIQAAIQETTDLRNIPYADQDWAKKTPEELGRMHPLSLATWLETIKRVKKWFKIEQQQNK
jgi:hypothetical protein